jgi:hypothetical protein
MNMSRNCCLLLIFVFEHQILQVTFVVVEVGWHFSRTQLFKEKLCDIFKKKYCVSASRNLEDKFGKFFEKKLSCPKVSS